MKLLRTTAAVLGCGLATSCGLWANPETPGNSAVDFAFEIDEGRFSDAYDRLCRTAQAAFGETAFADSYGSVLSPLLPFTSYLGEGTTALVDRDLNGLGPLDVAEPDDAYLANVEANVDHAEGEPGRWTPFAESTDIVLVLVSESDDWKICGIEERPVDGIALGWMADSLKTDG